MVEPRSQTAPTPARAPRDDRADAVAALSATVAELAARVADQAERLDAQQRELERLRARSAEDAAVEAAEPDPAPPDPAPTDHDPAEHGVDRRTLLRHAGVAAAAAVAAVGAGTVVRPEPAEAANGDAILIGQANVSSFSTAATSLLGSTFAASGNANPNTSQWGAITGLNGADNPGAAGVFGSTGSTVATSTMFGVRGSVSRYGGGVFGEAITNTPAIGAGLRGRSIAGPGLLLDRDLTGVPTTGTWSSGSFVMTTTGELWLCVLGGTPGTWRKLAGSSSAGTFHVLTPFRIYDSRDGFPPAGVTKGIFVDTTRTITAAMFGSGVPTGATAVLVNLAVTATGSGGFGSLFRAGSSWPGTASINWSSPSTTISNQAVTAVDASANFNCKIAGTAHVIIDVIGYWR